MSSIDGGLTAADIPPDPSPAAAEPGPPGEWRSNWVVVLVGLAGMTMISTGLYTLGVFIAPLQHAFGWSRLEITSVTSISAITGIVLGPLIGALVDKVGPRRVGVPGGVLYCVALALLALTNRSIWSWWLLWGLLHAVGLFISPVIWTSAVASSFNRSRGLALAVTLSGAGVALIILPNLARLLVDNLGWRAGFIGLALTMGATVAPLAWLFLRDGPAVRSRPAPSAPASATAGAGPSAMEAMRSFRFAQLALTVFLFTVGALSFSINLVPILSFIGMSRTSAAAMGAVVGAASMVGRISTGFLLDRFNPNLVGAGTVLTPILGCLCFVLAPGSVPAAVAGTFAIGLAQGAEYDVIAYLVARHFGIGRYGALFATLNAVLGIGAAVGPAMYSRFYDTTGSYLPALWTSIPLYLIGAILVATLGSGPGPMAAPSASPRPAEVP
jgi:MFS family permease